MENQSRLTSSKEVITFLASTFPQCFSAEGEARPLKIGIFQDLVERLQGQMGLSRTQLRNALRHYTASWRYLYGLKPGAVRVDLDGNPCGELEEQHVEYARKQLTEAKERVQARRLAQRQQQREQQSSAQRTEAEQQGNADNKVVADKQGKALRQQETHQRDKKKRDNVAHRQVAGDNSKQDNRQQHKTSQPQAVSPRDDKPAAQNKRTVTASERLAVPVDLVPVDLSTLHAGQRVKIRVGSNETEATVLDVAKEGVRVSLASGMSMLVRAEHVVC